MRMLRHGLMVLALLSFGGLAGTAYGAASDKHADKGKIDQNPTVEISYGDDASQYSKDGTCDDPRFSGPGVAKKLLPADTAHDATDCQAAIEAGTATFNGQSTPAVDFGDDTSSYANNQECDDPRFSGTGVADVLLNGDMSHDATDCRTLFESGSIQVIPVFTPDYAAGAPYDTSTVTFGNDMSTYAKNGDCDDPRFIGPGVAETLLDEDLLHDATDCTAAFANGTAGVRADAEANPNLDFASYSSTSDPSIDFGDNVSTYANDTECDDPRFGGESEAESTTSDNRRHDAKDCSTLFDAGKVAMIPVFKPDYVNGAPYDSSAIEFGDNTSEYKDNGQCDDPRFVGPGVADIVLEEDTSHDSADCKSTFEAGTAALKTADTATTTPTTPVDTTTYTSTRDASIAFGDDTSQYKDDGECDDPRFMGAGVDSVLMTDDLMHDAKDCSTLFDAGTVDLIPVFHPDYVKGAPYDSAGVDFGDNTSDYKDNGECDDPRFQGPGVADVVLDEDTLKDSGDCKTAFEAGTAALKAVSTAPDTTTPPADDTTPPPVNTSAIDYGDNASQYANDNECDDPRFVGEAMDDVLLTDDMNHDAADCQTLVESGKIALRPVFGADYVNSAPYDIAGVDFGDNTSDYKDNGECDDPRFAGPGMAAVTVEADTLKDAADCTTKFKAGLVAMK